MTAGMTQITPTGALSSLQNLRSFAAQSFGQAIAGEPIFDPQGGTGAGTPGAGAPPAGTVISSPGGGTGTVDPLAPAPYDPFAGFNGTVGAWGRTAAATAAAAAGASSAAGAGGAAGGPPPPPPPPGGGPPGGGGGGRGGGGWGAAQRALGYRIAVSGGSTSGVLGAIRRIPGLGLAADAVTSLGDAYGRQREAGRRYQEVEGGTNLEGQAERAHLGLYQLSMLGRMPEGASAAAFNAVTDLGFNRMASGQAGQMQDRQNALNFIYHNYTGRGMSVQDSAMILETASKSTVLSLNSVSGALAQVSNVAGKAGTNAQQARMEFNALLGTAISQGAAGGAGNLAGALAANQAALGQPFAGVNFSGQLSPAMQYMIAGKYGIEPNQAQYLMRTNPQAYAKLLAGNSSQVIGSYLSPREQSSLHQMIGQLGGPKAMTPGLLQQISTEFLNRWQAADPNLNTTVLAQVMSQQTGIPLTSGNVMEWITSQMAGINQSTYAASTSGSPVSARHPGKAPEGQYGLATARHPHGFWQNLSYYAIPGTYNNKSWQQVLSGGPQGQAASVYLGREQRTGRRSPVLEALLQNAQAGDHVMVQTRTGPRVMSFADAMRYYPQEMASGNAQFYDSSGRALGGTGSITHGLSDPSARVTGEESQRAGSRAGTPFAAWRKQHPSASSGSGGRYMVGLTQEARQLLKLLPGNYDQSAATGMVPAVPWVTQGSR
jgi:hypothetical protein